LGTKNFNSRGIIENYTGANVVMKQIGIVLPVYNEEEVISLFHQELTKVVDKLHQYDFRIIYVLDPSNDDSEKILAEISSKDPRVEVLVLSRRFGHQASLLAGIDTCDSDAVIMLDSDLQHPPSLIPKMLEIFDKEKVEIVQAIRVDGRQTGIVKKFTSNLFYRVLCWLSEIQLNQGAADFRLISRQVADVIRYQIREKNQFLRGLFSWIGFDVAYVSFVCQKRPKGTTKYSLARMINFALHGICSFSKIPLRAAIIVGSLSALVSLVIGVAEITRYFASGQESSGWLSIFSLMVFFGGIQMIILGILGEYIGLIFDEVKNRPNYIIHRNYK
jgi:polyisoprenyl-phosphate glycosyltransferase